MMQRTYWVAALMLLGAAPVSRAQQPPVAPRQPDSPCKLVFDDTAGTRVRSVKLPSGQYNTFGGGRVLAHCANQPTVQMRADSVEYYGEQGLLYLIGRVSYTAPRAVLDAHVTHFEQAEDVPESDPLATYLFPPELIMAHQRDLALQDTQRAKIIAEIEKAQAQFVGLQWTLSAAQERLKTLLESTAANEAQMLAQVDRTLAAERDIKRLQVTLLVRIKNTLTASQQAELTELRNGSSGTRFRLGNIF